MRIIRVLKQDIFCWYVCAAAKIFCLCVYTPGTRNTVKFDFHWTSGKLNNATEAEPNCTLRLRVIALIISRRTVSDSRFTSNILTTSIINTTTSIILRVLTPTDLIRRLQSYDRVSHTHIDLINTGRRQHTETLKHENTETAVWLTRSRDCCRPTRTLWGQNCQ